jgi:hypothetical protein
VGAALAEARAPGWARPTPLTDQANHAAPRFHARHGCTPAPMILLRLPRR